MASVLTVNRAQGAALRSGIDKHPTDERVEVRAPGPMHGGLGSGIVGDVIGHKKLHGGDDQAVYAYAREDLDDWQRHLGRELTNGLFGENMTTEGIDVTGAVIGERWRIGSDRLVLEVSRPRIPCQTFTRQLGIRGWVKTFTRAAVPGAYTRVIEPGTMCGGDAIEVIARPDHGVTIGLVFRAMTLEPELLPRLLDVDALPAEIAELARRRAVSG